MLKAYALSAILTLVLAATAIPAMADGDPASGEKIFAKCKICHSLDAGKNLVGPSLNAVVGRKSGTAAGFKYSDAMTGKAIVWNEENLEKYLRDPKGFIPNNKMVFPGLKDKESDDVIAFLKKAAK